MVFHTIAFGFGCNPYWNVEMSMMFLLGSVPYDLGDIFGGQSHFCDADGNAVVVSVNSTGNFTYSTIGAENFLISTNFNVAWPDNHYDPYPCPRYETANNYA